MSYRIFAFLPFFPWWSRIIYFHVAMNPNDSCINCNNVSICRMKFRLSNCLRHSWFNCQKKVKSTLPNNIDGFSGLPLKFSIHQIYYNYMLMSNASSNLQDISNKIHNGNFYSYKSVTHQSHELEFIL